MIIGIGMDEQQGLPLYYDNRFSGVTVNKKFLRELSKVTNDKFTDYFYFVYTSISKSNKKITKESFVNNLSKIGLYFYYSFCPYCKKASLTLHVYHRPTSFMGSYCGFCGEQDLHAKAVEVFRKVNLLLELTIAQEEQIIRDDTIGGHKYTSNKIKELNTILYEQIIVLLATSLEVFLKDAYSLTLNLTLIKSGKSEIERFRKECKNDFVNMGKITSSFKSIGFDLKNLIDADTRTNINQIFFKRHVIVHNNGIADKEYTSQSGDTINVGNRIVLKFEDLKRYLSSVKNIIEVIGEKAAEGYHYSLVEEFNDRIWEVAPFAMINRVRNYVPEYSLLHSPNLITMPDINKVFPKPISPSKEELEKANNRATQL